MSNNKNSGANLSIDIILRVIKIILLVALIVVVIGGMMVGGMVAAVLKDTPEVDPTTMISSLNQTSTIYDSQGELLEKVQTTEYRTVVTLDKMPKYLKDAFIAIEDERFLTHPGVDIIGIGASVLDNIRAGSSVRGASTITQQLVRNMYLTNDKSLVRKLTEAYLSLQVEETLSKDQILEAYLNKIYLGQGAYGVQEAAQTYFSKNVEDLTIAEAAVFAGIVKSTTNYQPFMRIEPSDYDPETMELVGQTEVLGQNMYLIYNPESIERQHIVLNQMKKLEKITEAQYQEAMSQDILASLNPGQKIYHSMSSYFVDYAQTEATRLLAKHYDISYEDAQKKVFNEGLRIYSTVDVALQKNLEYMYDNFTEIMVGDPSKIRAPFLLDWSRDRSENIIDANGRIVYYKYGNLMDDNHNIVLPSSAYEILEDGIILKSRIFSAYNDTIDIADVYTINGENNLVTHAISPIVVPSTQYTVLDDGNIKIMKVFLDDNPDLYTINPENGILTLSERFYTFQKNGVVQPQSATVIMDYRTGEVKALVGGRDVEGNRILNRATSSQRQPGSAIKPISVYLPALAIGKTAGSISDDVPITVNGKAWPRNAYAGYKGLQTYRQALNMSSNAGTVNVLEQIGIKTSLEYLEKLGIIDSEHPESDSIVTAEENRNTNDENLAALALGGMTKGLTPLELTAAFGAIANDGVFIEPKVVSRILDKNGNIIIDNTTVSREIVDPQTAYIMKDMLRTTVLNGFTAKPAKLTNMVTAGKTGTTQEQADIWFVGFTPYYVMGTWVGNDSPKVTLKSGSLAAAEFWHEVGEKIHEGLEPINSFEEPEGIITKTISSKSGLLGTKLSSSMGVNVNEMFKEGTEPTSYDDSYKSATVCTVSGRLATKWCPSTTTKTFFVRPEPYKASEHGGYVPSDVGSSVPRSYCNIHTEASYNEYYYGPYGPGFIFKPENSSPNTSTDSDDSN